MKRWAFILAGVAYTGAAVAQQPAPHPPSPPGPPSPFASMQWLYGSGEGAASSMQAYRAFANYVLLKAQARPADSVVLARDASLAAPRFVPCGAAQRLAVVLDVDETAIQNLGYEYDRDVRGYGYGTYSWDRWEKSGGAHVRPMPGAVEALRAIRAANVTVIFNTNRSAANAAANEAMLDAAGLGPARHDADEAARTLWLQGDTTPANSGKDERRAIIARNFCVIAMAGDQLGDFSDLFNVRTLTAPQRRQAAATAPFDALWGYGWFMLSNPVYGPSMAGTRNDVFSEPATRWLDPEGAPVE